ncbi:hemolysin family protein [Allonocardiopsis opalescens]|uniref:CBS domain containing-hemolysin-like protein n=1 Tax=Allonocardiopsis opalescens TaxID=1144618 RepID=A0A2T0PTU1_9ACTN|nr:hemolysin family protein [Allonocardiopsis opalescens]PRX92317.1 CBS domain containing-hemolysin-like protein [Allonocardiopsis opalescens]
MNILLGVLVVIAITAATGYFVAQEFAYVAVDRARLRTAAARGDATAARALAITDRLSFTLSAAQFGITVTALLVGYVAEPLIGEGIADLLAAAGLPVGLAPGAGLVLALLFATVVQMVLGELFPKNAAIARPEPLARALSASTAVYLRVVGPVVWLFDTASERFLRLIGVEPVGELQHAATPRELARIVSDSRDSGDLPLELSTLLDRTLDFYHRTAEHAMTPRPHVEAIDAGEPVVRVIDLLASGHSRFPVVGAGVDDIVGVVCIRDVLALTDEQRRTLRVEEVARPPLPVPTSLPLTALLDELNGHNEQFACVVDEYGGLAGVITLEDIAEELVGEIADEHDTEGEPTATGDGSWVLPGSTHIDEVERMTSVALPEGDYETIGGLAIARLQRLPQPGDHVEIDLEPPPAEDDPPELRARLVVESVDRRVPASVRLHLLGPAARDTDRHAAAAAAADTPTEARR